MVSETAEKLDDHVTMIHDDTLREAEERPASYQAFWIPPRNQEKDATFFGSRSQSFWEGRTRALARSPARV